MEYEYLLENGRLVLLGLTEKETTEFETLDAQIPYDGKPVWPDTANSPTEDRWLELFTKYEVARHAPRFGSRISTKARTIAPQTASLS